MKTKYLGKTHSDIKASAQLEPIPRLLQRQELNMDSPFLEKGWDLWNAYEVSFLDKTGKPQTRMLQFIIPSSSLNIIESKSFKLYLNSFNQKIFQHEGEFLDQLRTDLTRALEIPLKSSLQEDSNIDKADQLKKKLPLGSELIIREIPSKERESKVSLSGLCLDDLSISSFQYTYNKNLLTKAQDNRHADFPTERSFYFKSFRSNCLVTNQPDWALIEIKTLGNYPDAENLLKYLASFRQHQEFHEHCVERIFSDLLKRVEPTELFVQARFTRRGGLDINPLRSTSYFLPKADWCFYPAHNQ